MNRWISWTVVIAIYLICSVRSSQGKTLTEDHRLQAETLYKEGLELHEDAKFVEAAKRFREAIGVDHTHAPSYVGLGHIFLEQENLKEAERAFKKGLRKQRKYAPAFNGLGLVYSKKKNELRRAINYFREANRADKFYSLAQYNLAKTLQRFGHSETLKAFKDVLKIDPNHQDANYQIGLIHEVHRDYQKAELAYRKQIKVNPVHYGALLHLGLVLKIKGETQEAENVLKKVVVDQNLFQRRALLELGNVYKKQRKFNKSQTHFSAYISGLDVKERSLYYDLRLIAQGKDLKKIKEASSEEREVLIKAFWAARDPAPVTEANERMLEHYRRVAFARENFGSHRFPWDARGESFIRYGKPDHISRSNDIKIEQHPRVLNVKNRLVAKAGLAAVRLAQDRQNEVLSRHQGADRNTGNIKEVQRRIKSQNRLQRSESLIVESSFLGWPVYPVETVRSWEYWIYTDVGPGIELIFVQKKFPGPYEYPDIPLDQGEIGQTWRNMHSKIILDNVTHRTPNVYRPDFATGPLDFYFYSSVFRGDEGKTSLEVYYGIPVRQLTYGMTQDGREVAYLERGMAVYDSTGQPVERQSRKIVLTAGSLPDTSDMALLSEVDRIDLLPGNYRLSVQVLDRISGKSQVYNQERMLPYFGEKELQMSDIEMAASIKPTGRRQFLKGDIAVVPMPSRAYEFGEPVLIYYEIYNLKPDSFGATSYRVLYEMQSREKNPLGAKILAGLGTLLGIREDGSSIRIEYEQVGVELEEQAYLELDMSKSGPGEYFLKIEITDKNSNQTVETKTTFRIH